MKSNFAADQRRNARVVTWGAAPAVTRDMTNANTALAAPVGLRYNYGMKTAVSIPDAVYRAGELLAKRLKLPRSRLYALALADYVERHADEDITQRLNASLAAHPAAPDPFMREASSRTLERSEW